MSANRTPFAIFVIILVILFYTETVLKTDVPVAPISESSPNISDGDGTYTTTTNVGSNSSIANNTSENTNNQNAALAALGAQTFTEEDFKNSPTVRIKTDLVTLKFRELGGRISSLRLNNFKRNLSDKDKLDLINLNTKESPLGLRVGGYSDDTVKYTFEGATPNVKKSKTILTVPEGEAASFRFKGTLPDGSLVFKTISVEPHNYLITLDVEHRATQNTGSKTALIWHELFNEKDSSQYNIKQITTHNISLRDTNRIGTGKLSEVPIIGSNNWIALGDNYFTEILVSADPQAETSSKMNDKYIQLSIASSQQNPSFKFYVGPKDKDLLASAGFNIDRSMDLGWFAVIGQPLLSALKFINSLVGNYGLAIILLTLILKLVLLPLTQSSFKSMKAMQKLQPQMQALREKYKGEPSQLNVKMMELYKQNGVNPLGGCVPALLQVPIFLGMFNALTNSIDLRHAEFALWINDLAAPEQFIFLGLPIPVMVLLMGASMFVQMLTTPFSGDPLQRKVMLFMPIIFTASFIVLPIPSGLVLYWLVSNLISIAQQLSLHRLERISALQSTLIGSILIMLISYLLTLM